MGTQLKVLFAAFAVGLLAMPARAQNSAITVDDAISGYESATHQFYQGVPTDWSSYHAIFAKPEPGSDAEYKVQQDPRYWMQVIRRSTQNDDSSVEAQASPELAAAAKAKKKKKPNASRKLKKLKIDWSVSLGAGGVARGMYPAKFNFSTTNAPNCITDFAVFPINTSTSNTRAHVIGTFSANASSAGTVAITVTPTGVAAFTLNLTASTSSNIGTSFQVFTAAGMGATEATNLAAAINRNLSSTALYRFVAVASASTVTVYALTPGNRLVLGSPADTGVANLSWGTVSAGTNGTQANFVGLNQLYSGSGTPFCTGLSFPEFIFSYASGVGPVATSPTISASGTKIAYVENDTNIGAILHVLTIGSSTEHGACTNTGLAAPTCATATGPVIPGSTSGSTATDFMLPLGLIAHATIEADTISSPFVNYSSDIGYIGDNAGLLYSVTGVFTGTPAHAGSPWPVTVSSGHILTAPVVDLSNTGTGNIFIGDNTGVLYNYTSAGVQKATLPVGTTTAGGIVDAPLVDGTSSMGYVTVGCDGTGSSNLTQFMYTGTTLTTTGVGRIVELSTAGCGGAGFPMYAPTPDNNYYTKGISSATPSSNGELIVAFTANTHLHLDQFQFTSSRMSATAQFDDNAFLTTGGPFIISPLTEFDNTTLTKDFLFFGVDNPDAYTFTLPMTSATQTPAATNTISVSGGTSAMIVDNNSSNGQASSIYFGTLTTSTGECGTTVFCAVKLTQALLQ